jgi:mitochondrial import inner membrane translocase subunit TIM22
MTEADREQVIQAKKYMDLMSMGMESCVTKTVIAGIGGKHLETYKVCTMERF